jgi:disulfide bond formation protein DsbB
VGTQHLERHADLNVAWASPRLVLAAIAVVGALALVLAWVLQHRFDYQPCPWCVLQRLLVFATAVVCLAGCLVQGRPGQLTAVLVASVLSCVGAGVAFYQHFVAAKTASCNLTLADRIIGGLGLADLWPGMFEATARCDEADRPWLGVPFSLWGAALFALFAVAAIGSLWRTFRKRRRH